MQAKESASEPVMRRVLTTSVVTTLQQTLATNHTPDPRRSPARKMTRKGLGMEADTDEAGLREQTERDLPDGTLVTKDTAVASVEPAT